jgi:hypothetical protein
LEPPKLQYSYLSSTAKDVVDLTANMIATGSSAVVTIPTINVERGVGSYYFDHLIEEEKKSKGRKKIFRTLRVSREQSSRKLST